MESLIIKILEIYQQILGIFAKTSSFNYMDLYIILQN